MIAAADRDPDTGSWRAEAGEPVSDTTILNRLRQRYLHHGWALLHDPQHGQWTAMRDHLVLTRRCPAQLWAAIDEAHTPHREQATAARRHDESGLDPITVR